MVVALSGAPGSLALAALLAAVPVGPLVGCFMWLDRYEPEPRNLLVAGLLWGAFAATGAAIVFQGLGLAGGATERDVLSVVAPVTEEVTKGAFLFLLLWWRRHELDGVLDGIVYAGMVGVGFAYTENILYLAAAYDGTDGLGPGGTTALTSTFIVRCLISPFAHPFFTAFVGHRGGPRDRLAPDRRYDFSRPWSAWRWPPSSTASGTPPPSPAPATSSSSTAR